MSSRYDLVSPRKAKDSDKTYFTKIGVAFANRSGEGFTLSFEALPLPDAEGQVRVLMMPPRERDAAPAAGGTPRRQSAQARPADDDDIPFFCQWR